MDDPVRDFLKSVLTNAINHPRSTVIGVLGLVTILTGQQFADVDVQRWVELLGSLGVIYVSLHSKDPST